MDRKDLLQLEILKHVEETPRLNNRMAARKLGVSVKLAHEILRKMVTKGLLHVKKEHARRWDYFLTPSGIAEKTRLTYEFLDFSMQFYREARRRSAQLCRDLSEAGVKRVAFLGAGELAEEEVFGTAWATPEIERALKLAEARVFDVLVLRKMERLERSLARQLCLENEFDRCGILQHGPVAEGPPGRDC